MHLFHFLHKILGLETIWQILENVIELNFLFSVYIAAEGFRPCGLHSLHLQTPNDIITGPIPAAGGGL